MYRKSDAFCKGLDKMSDEFRFDTFFFIGGKYSFCDIIEKLIKMLELPLENNFSTLVDFDYIWFPSDYENWGDEFELGFYDAKLEDRRRQDEEEYRRRLNGNNKRN